MSNDSRQAFEAHEMSRVGGSKPLTWDDCYEPEEIADHKIGTYLIKADQQAWEAWQAALRWAASQAGEAVAWAVMTDEGDVAMVFLEQDEAWSYCSEGEAPVPLVFGGTTSRQTAPPGYKLVPVEPTPEMLSRAIEDCGGIGGGSCGEYVGADWDDMRGVWAAMLAATPPAPGERDA